jgi:putative addiction module component (TIGR02574 family)
MSPSTPQSETAQMSNPLIDAIQQLSVDERIELVAQICDSIPDDPNAFDLSPEIQEVLDRRVQEMESDPKSGMTIEELKAFLRRSA